MTLPFQYGSCFRFIGRLRRTTMIESFAKSNAIGFPPYSLMANLLDGFLVWRQIVFAIIFGENVGHITHGAPHIYRFLLLENSLPRTQARSLAEQGTPTSSLAIRLDTYADETQPYEVTPNHPCIIQQALPLLLRPRHIRLILRDHLRFAC